MILDKMAQLSAFAGRLRSLREAKDLGRRKLAALAGVSPSLLDSYETGRTPPLAAILAQFADTLGVTMDSLWRSADPASPARSALGVPIGLDDRHGRTIHIGDTLRFDEAQWGGPCEFTVTLAAGTIRYPGSPSDLSDWCEVIRPWDSADPSTLKAPWED